MYKHFDVFSWVAVLATGSIFFATLFHFASQLSLVWIAGSAVLLIVLHIDIKSINDGINQESFVKLIVATAETLEEQKRNDGGQSLLESYSSLAKRNRFGAIAENYGMAWVMVLLAKYGVWVGCGWAISNYMLKGVAGAA